MDGWMDEWMDGWSLVAADRWMDGNGSGNGMKIDRFRIHSYNKGAILGFSKTDNARKVLRVGQSVNTFQDVTRVRCCV